MSIDSRLRGLCKERLTATCCNAFVKLSVIRHRTVMRVTYARAFLTRHRRIDDAPPAATRFPESFDFLHAARVWRNCCRDRARGGRRRLRR
ncbi:hypothetical protein, partial [Burkholderia humptydooensis]|uniref:hypothetical protein n=1 Tax=Burkholderia humptydooensis TaxID=430531 RepID=UPI001E2E763E